MIKGEFILLGNLYENKRSAAGLVDRKEERDGNVEREREREEKCIIQMINYI